MIRAVKKEAAAETITLLECIHTGDIYMPTAGRPSFVCICGHIGTMRETDEETRPWYGSVSISSTTER